MESSNCRTSNPRRSLPFGGFFFDDFAADSAWLREKAWLQLPAVQGIDSVTLRGEYKPHPDVQGFESLPPTVKVQVVGGCEHCIGVLKPGAFSVEIPLPGDVAHRGARLTISLGGPHLALTNALAWLGRITGWLPLRRFRAQNKNRQIRITQLTTATNEVIFDFSIRFAPYSTTFARRYTQIEFNLVGFLTADLGVGESARCMVRSADAANIRTALVSLKLPCLNRLGDAKYADRQQDTNPYKINIIHIDAPASPDIDRDHGHAFRAGKYNIGYWAWELPEFPDVWIPNFAYFDEIWTPSEFARIAIAKKSPLPVLAMPHAISFPRPIGNFRPHFGLPEKKFLFLFLCDLNSYAARKNPQAVLAAYRVARLADAALVIKVQNATAHPAILAELRAAVRDLPNTTLLTATFSRDEIYGLESSCDCFVSLHRAEGFGLAIAESMYLGKPVIATNWSGSSEFLNAETGCPVRFSLVPVSENNGPYSKGQIWAEPDIEHAAEWMRRLVADRGLAAEIGMAGQAEIEKHFSPKAIGARYRERLEAIAAF